MLLPVNSTYVVVNYSVIRILKNNKDLTLLVIILNELKLFQKCTLSFHRVQLQTQIHRESRKCTNYFSVILFQCSEEIDMRSHDLL